MSACRVQRSDLRSESQQTGHYGYEQLCANSLEKPHPLLIVCSHSIRALMFMACVSLLALLLYLMLCGRPENGLHISDGFTLRSGSFLPKKCRRIFQKSPSTSSCGCFQIELNSCCIHRILWDFTVEYRHMKTSVWSSCWPGGRSKNYSVSRSTAKKKRMQHFSQAASIIHICEVEDQDSC